MNDPVLEALNHIPRSPQDERERQISRLAFIRLWTLATPPPTYDKEGWLRVESQLRRFDLI